MARSLKVLLASIGSRGDVQPMLALALALAARGHAATVAAPADFDAWVRGLGFPFAPLGADIQAWLASNPAVMTGNTLTMVREVTRYLKTHVGAQAMQLKAAAQGCDVMVYAGLALPIAPSVSECLGLPAIRVNYTTALTASDVP